MKRLTNRGGAFPAQLPRIPAGSPSGGTMLRPVRCIPPLWSDAMVVAEGSSMVSYEHNTALAVTGGLAISPVAATTPTRTVIKANVTTNDVLISNRGRRAPLPHLHARC